MFKAIRSVVSMNRVIHNSRAPLKVSYSDWIPAFAGMTAVMAIALIMLLSSASFASTTAPTEKEWQDLTDGALDYYYYGRKKEAVEVARQALRVAEKLFGTDDLKVVGSIDNLATYTTSLGNVEEADQLYQRALAMLEKKLPPDDQYLAIFMDYLALFYDKINKNEYADELRARAKVIRLKGPSKSKYNEPLRGSLHDAANNRG